MTGTARIIRGNALDLPLADGSVDLVVTSPPYFGLRSYQDGGEHYSGQIGDEATPAEFVDALVAATAEMVRVLKPSGSIWVNLGDKYASTSTPGPQSQHSTMTGGRHKGVDHVLPRRLTSGAPPKSLIGVPWRYALRCIDDLGLILRAEVIWSKPNGLPESVTDRVRRSHETWFHFTKSPRYFSAVDEIREEHSPASLVRYKTGFNEANNKSGRRDQSGNVDYPDGMVSANPLGKLPGSVWTVPTQPLRVPAHLGIDHFAAFPMEWPRRIIRGWSPSGVCVECGEGRRPVVLSGAPFPREEIGAHRNGKATAERGDGATVNNTNGQERNAWRAANPHTIAGYSCACPDGGISWETSPDSGVCATCDTASDWANGCSVCGAYTSPANVTPAVVLDPFGGTGTTALVAKALGRHGISNDMSADYCRLATWRTNDEGELARAMEVDKPAKQIDGQGSLLDLIGGEAS